MFLILQIILLVLWYAFQPMAAVPWPIIFLPTLVWAAAWVFGITIAALGWRR